MHNCTYIFIMAVIFQSTLLDNLSANNQQHEDHLDAWHDDGDGRLLGQLLLQPLPLGEAQHVSWGALALSWLMSEWCCCCGPQFGRKDGDEERWSHHERNKLDLCRILRRAWSREGPALLNLAEEKKFLSKEARTNARNPCYAQKNLSARINDKFAKAQTAVRLSAPLKTSWSCKLLLVCLQGVPLKVDNVQIKAENTM